MNLYRNPKAPIGYTTLFSPHLLNPVVELDLEVSGIERLDLEEIHGRVSLGELLH